MRRSGIVFLGMALALVGCVAEEAADRGEIPAEGAGPYDEIPLGPVDGLDLPPTDLDRVQVGDVAPDFTLRSLGGPPVTLSTFRGSKKVVLVFYRGHW